MVFKCKMCGGDIEPIKDTNTGKCLYCKSIMTLPVSNDEKIINLYNRANDLRLGNEFDKALGIYESILEIDNKQIEAHWGIVLCKYGVEYVDDPKTKKKIPTCHRTKPALLLEDLDYKYIIKNSVGEALELYKNEAQQINKIQKHILEISKKEEPYDIFICYKETDEKGERTHDSVIAEDIYDKLIKEGYKVFFSRITLEDKLGTEYEPYIYSALATSKIMIVVGTSEENFNAIWVKNEWSRYLEFAKEDGNKTLIPVYSRIDAYKLPEDFAMLQAQNMDKVGAMQDLVKGIKKILLEPKTDNNFYKKINDNYYEVEKITEKLPTWYHQISIVFIIILLIANMVNFASAHGWEVLNVTIIEIILSFISFIFNVVGVVFSFFDKKDFKISRKCFKLGLILKVIAFLDILRYLNAWLEWHFGFYLIFTIIIDLFFAFFNPKWYIDSNKVVVNKEELGLIIKENNNVYDNLKIK